MIKVFFVFFIFLNSIKSNLIDNLYNDCNQDVYRRLEKECVGFNFENKRKNCLADKSCNILAIFQVLPGQQDSNYFDEKLNLTLINTNHQTSLDAQLSLIIDASFNRRYILGEGSYYNCSYSSKKNRVESSVKHPNRSSMLVGSGYLIDGLMVCSWLMNKKDEEWPSLYPLNKVNLFSTQVEIIFVMNEQMTPIIDVRIPIFKNRHLYNGCNNLDKFCMGPNRCDKMYFICDVLLIIEQNSRSNDILDWSLYAFYEPKNGEGFEVRLSSYWAGPAFSVNCDKSGFKQYSHFVNGSRALITNSVITNDKIIKDSQFEGLRCFWSTPKKFSIYPHKYDTTNTKYFVKLKNFLTFWEEELGLPGYRLEKNLYQDCKKPLKERITYDCYGLNSSDLNQDCFQTETCSMIVVFEVEVRKNGNRYVDEDVILRAYHIDFDANLDSHIFIVFDLDDGSNQKINYSCSHDNKRAQVTHANDKSFEAGRVSLDYGVFGCFWELKKDKKTWPILRNNTLLNLILKKVSITLGLKSKSKKFDQNQVALPIFKLRYLYGDCTKFDSICFGKDKCVENMNCTNLINFVQRSQGSDVIDVNIYALDNSDRLKITFSKDNILGDDFGVECNDRVIEDFFIFQNLTNKPSFLHSRSLISYKLFAKDVFGLFGCYWSQPKEFEVYSQKYDTRLNRYYANVTFFKSNKEKVLMLEQISLPGYTQKLNQQKNSSNAMITVSLIPFVMSILLLLIIKTPIYP